MDKKTINIIGVFFIFLIGFIIHNLYEWVPYNILTPFVPVNESVFEHIKMIFTSYMIWILIKRILYKKFNINEPCFLFKEVLITIFEILFFLCIFMPIYSHHLENLMLTLFVYFVTISVSTITGYFIQFKNNHKVLNMLSFIVIIIIYILFSYLTFRPPINNFFLDSINNSYGLNK